jgi:hypothetical protein
MDITIVNGRTGKGKTGRDEGLLARLGTGVGYKRGPWSQKGCFVGLKPSSA